MVFRYLLRQVLSLTLSPMLRTTIFITEVFHTTVLSTCNLMQDLIDTNRNSNNEVTLLADMARNHNPDFISSSYNSSASACTQTEKQPTLSVRNKRAGSTEVVIHNMHSSEKVIIIQTDSPATGKRKKRVRCENCKSETRSRSLKDESVKQKHASERSFRKKQGASDSSSMSLENDVSETKIIEYSQNDLLPKSMSECQSSRILSNCNSDFMRKSRILAEKSQPEISRIFELPAIESLDEEDSDSHKQKTSSPVERFEEQAKVNYWNTFPRNCLINENVTSFSELNPVTEKAKENSRLSETFSLPGKKFKRRLSLPLEFKSNEGFANSKLFRDKSFGDVSSSSKFKKTSAYLKFPTSLEACAANRLGDEINDSRGILSSSSYESLPVSDHLQTVAEKNSLSYSKNFTDDVSCNFSSGDELVETFQNIKDELTGSEIVENKISEDTFLSNANKLEKDVRELNQESPDIFINNAFEHALSGIPDFEMEEDNLDKQISSELSNCETGIPDSNTDFKRQREELQVHRVLSNDSAISSPDSSSSVQEAVETTLNEVIERLH